MVFPLSNKLLRFFFLFLCVLLLNQLNGFADALISIDFNTPSPGTTTEITPYIDYDMTAAGNQFGIHLSRDEGRFAYTTLTGDFDVWCRIAIVDNEVKNLATAGIMARKSLSSDAEFVSIIANSRSPKWDATYGVDAYIWGVRLRPGGHITESMSADRDGYWYCAGQNRHIIPFPNCWLRLVRTGNTFRGYFAETPEAPKPNQWRQYGFQSTWTLTGQTPPTFIDKNGIFPQKLYVGICLDANAEEWGNTRHKARAEYREIHGLDINAVVEEDQSPDNFVLMGNYPNPFNSSTTISYIVAHPTYIRLEIFDCYGKLVKTLVDTIQSDGRYEIKWNGTDRFQTSAASGVYILRIAADGTVHTQKIMLLR